MKQLDNVMAVKITLKEDVDPVDFINKIKELIDLGNQKGGIASWQYEPTAEFSLIHTGGSEQQWNRGAYMKVFRIENPMLFIFRQTHISTLTPGTYGVLNGRFVEMLINHLSYLYISLEVLDYRE